MNPDHDGTLEEQRKARILAAVNKSRSFKLAAMELGCCARTVSRWVHNEIKARRDPATGKWIAPVATVVRCDAAIQFPNYSNSETRVAGSP